MDDKKLHLIVFIFVSVLHLQMLFAQNTINVYFVKGDSECVSKKQTEFKLSKNFEIPEGSMLKLEPQTELTLKDDKGRFCILNSGADKKVLTYRKLQKEFDLQENSGLLAAVYSFMKKELSKDHTDIRDYADHNLKIQGGISRSSCGTAAMINPGFDAKVDFANGLFYWHGDKDAEHYTFKLFGGDGELQNAPLLYTTSVIDTFLRLELNELIPDNTTADVFSWLAFPATEVENCRRYNVSFYNGQILDEVLESINTKALEFEEEKDKYLFLASSYEDAGYLDLAKQNFELLNKEYPSKLYQDLLIIFLARNGML